MFGDGFEQSTILRNGPDGLMRVITHGLAMVSLSAREARPKVRFARCGHRRRRARRHRSAAGIAARPSAFEPQNAVADPVHGDRRQHLRHGAAD
jgi:hypothetical protein